MTVRHCRYDAIYEKRQWALNIKQFTKDQTRVCVQERERVECVIRDSDDLNLI